FWSCDTAGRVLAHSEFESFVLASDAHTLCFLQQNKIELRDIASGATQARVTAEPSWQVDALDFAPDGERFAVGDSNVRVFAAHGGRLERTFAPPPGANGACLHLRFSRDGDRLAALWGKRTIAVYDLRR